MQSAAFRRHSTMAFQDFGATDEKVNRTFSMADFLSNKKTTQIYATECSISSQRLIWKTAVILTLEKQ